MRSALPDVHTELGKLEASLVPAAWLVGAEMTAADSTAYPFLKLLLRAAERVEASHLELELLSLERPRVRALRHGWSTIERLPGYERTYPPHWRR